MRRRPTTFAPSWCRWPFPDFIAYVIPGILLITAGGGATGTAISVAMDMAEGIVARFKTMAVARASVLAGHVLSSTTDHAGAPRWLPAR